MRWLAKLTRPLRQLRKATGAGRSKSLRRRLQLLSGSPLFDASWYQQSYPDVRDSGVDPARHYLESGWKEGRDPGPEFSTSAYLKANADVASLGINPLLHFIEFGRAEGRGMPSQASPPRSTLDPEQSFGPAGACVRFANAAASAVAWRRAAQIEAGPATLRAGREVIAVASELVTADQFEEALGSLGWLSGRSEVARSSLLAAAGECPSICDIWHAGRGILRSRWNVDLASPLVIRAVQHVGPNPLLIGEGLISTSAEVFDIRLLNPYFPLLLLFCEPDGSLRGLRLMHFPSLCRGGVHYPELLAMHDSQQQAPDIITVDAQLGAALCDTRLPSGVPVVDDLMVDMSGADGTHRLFQQDFQRWLADVMRVRVRAAPGPCDGTASKFLDQAIETTPLIKRNEGAAVLRLAHDMVPAIGALVGAATKVDDMVGSMLVSDDDSSRPAWLVRVAATIPADGLAVPPASLPTLHPTGLRQRTRTKAPAEIVLALKSDVRPLSELERLFPYGSVAEASSPGPAITWLMVAGRDVEMIRWTVESLNLQIGKHQLLLIGQPSRDVIDLASRLMKGGVRTAKSLSAACSMVDTELIGQIGSGIVLHDRQTGAILSRALSQSNADIVSAPILTSARGKNGTLHSQADQATAALHFLPRSLIPIAEVPGDFWIARSEQLASISTAAARRHMLCTQASVTRLASAKDGRVLFQPAADPALPVISFEPLIG